MNGNMAVQQHIPIPKGFEYVTGEKIDGFVIRNTADGSEFTWFPVDILEPNGTLDGINFCEKFGRRNFRNENFSQYGYHESVNPELLASIEKYDGCYISRYVASTGNGKPVFKKDKRPWVDILYCDARDQARSYAEGLSDIGSCEVCGAAWDSIMQWLIQTVATEEEVIKDSTSWGNYWSIVKFSRQIITTGSSDFYEVNHIADLAGNVDEWTSEMFGDEMRVVRGGGQVFPDIYDIYYAAVRNNILSYLRRHHIGFRILLYVK